jgi:SAM-dependent methyltransferase
MLNLSDLPSPLRLNLGSGPQGYSGYLNVDFDPRDNPDILHDLTQPLPLPDDSVDAIFLSHVIEHFPQWQIQDLLQDWCRVLKRGTGTLWGFVPDGARVAQEYLKAVAANDRYTKSVCVANFCGGWTNNKYIGLGQVHYYVYDADSLSETLSRGGFYPVNVMAQQAGPLDYRLVFVCGKGVYEPHDIHQLGVYPNPPWAKGLD